MGRTRVTARAGASDKSPITKKLPVAAAPAPAKAKAKKQAAPAKQKKASAPAAAAAPEGGGGSSRKYDPLSIPNEVKKRAVRRSGTVRVSEAVLAGLDPVPLEFVAKLVAIAMRRAVSSNRSILKAADGERALVVNDIHIY